MPYWHTYIKHSMQATAFWCILGILFSLGGWSPNGSTPWLFKARYLPWCAPWHPLRSEVSKSTLRQEIRSDDSPDHFNGFQRSFQFFWIIWMYMSFWYYWLYYICTIAIIIVEIIQCGVPMYGRIQVWRMVEDVANVWPSSTGPSNPQGHWRKWSANLFDYIYAWASARGHRHTEITLFFE